MSDRDAYAALLRRDATFFLRHAMHILGGEGEYIHNWHIDAILYELELTSLGENRRLIITMPPRHLKSTTASIAWPAWMLGRNPKLRFITVSYGAELAEKQGRDTLKLIDDPMYRLAFPQLQLTKRSAHDFETSLGGGRLSTSLGGPITGRGADFIIIDDPTKSREAASQLVRDGEKEWLLNTAMTRFNDPATGRIILVMQRLHDDDLVGELQRRGGWKELRLPAIAEMDELIAIGPGRNYQRRTGHALHPARQSLATLGQMRREIGSSNFAAQFQQNPVPASGIVIKAEWLKSYDPSFDPAMSPGMIVQSWDTASKDSLRNDWSVCVTAHVHQRRVRILDVFRRRLLFPDLLRNAKRLAKDYRAGTILIEDQSSGTQLLQSLWADRSHGIARPLRQQPVADKRVRIEGVSNMIENGEMMLPTEAHWLAEFKSELLGFPNSRFADQVDALSQLLAWVRDRGGVQPFRPVSPIIVTGPRPGPG
jgi:predicted phage terminase large subunit-like protein